MIKGERVLSKKYFCVKWPGILMPLANNLSHKGSPFLTRIVEKNCPLREVRGNWSVKIGYFSFIYWSRLTLFILNDLKNLFCNFTLQSLNCIKPFSCYLIGVFFLLYFCGISRTWFNDLFFPFCHFQNNAYSLNRNSTFCPLFSPSNHKSLFKTFYTLGESFETHHILQKK